MSNPGEWITFAELARRVPNRSAKTLRRYYRTGVISYRQILEHGPVEFNWRTVERELRASEKRGVHAAAAVMLDEVPADVRAELAWQRRLIEQIAAAVGVPAEFLVDEQSTRTATEVRLPELRALGPRGRKILDEAEGRIYCGGERKAGSDIAARRPGTARHPNSARSSLEVQHE